MQLSLSSLTFIMEFQLYWPCFKFWKLIVCLLFFFGRRVIKFNLTFHPFTLIPMILYTYLFFQQSMLYFTTHSSLHTSAIFLSILFFFFFFSFSSYNQIYPEKVNMVHAWFWIDPWIQKVSMLEVDLFLYFTKEF